MKIEKLKPILKKIPYSLFQMCNFFILVLFTINLPGDLTSDYMPWNHGCEDLWSYKSKINYTISTVSIIAFFLTIWSIGRFFFKRKIWLGTLIAAIPYLWNISVLIFDKIKVYL